MECESGIRIVKKYMMISLRLSYQHTIRNHPILMAMLCFLLLLNTLFPVLFSFLLYISPVVICTALLLGTLLSYGQTTYIPEHDVGVDVDDMDAGVLNDSVNIVERDGSIQYVGLDDDGGAPLVAENLQVNEKRGVDGLLDDSEARNETEILDDQDVAGIEYTMLSKDGLILEDSSGQQLDDTHVDVDVDDNDNNDDNENEEEGDEEEDDDESSISGSSTSESSGSGSVSSPDASMADIMPMLDELHPLLDLDGPQPAHISHDGSEAEDDNGDDEEEAHDDDDDKESGQKSAITWTEDDQKNLIDLGTSEIERNLRLENLIARRRARRLAVEKNLIDLDSADPPLNMAPISTIRGNPFDPTYDFYESNPIPGSAPSMMFPRKNPFDIPYDSSEEKPNLTGDSFEQEFKKTFPHKDAFFRRHESFSVGSSAFGGSRHASKRRPFFVPEKLAPDGVNYHLFERQSSGFSDSKASSNPETGSICSSADEEEKTLIEHAFLPEITHPEASLSVDQISNRADIGSDAEHDIESDAAHEDVGSDSDHGQHRSVLEQVKLGNVSDHIESGSGSSEHLDIDEEPEIKTQDVENYIETGIEMNLAASGERSYDEFVESDVRPNVEVDEEGSAKSRSSSSSSSSSASSSDDEVINYKKENTLINSSLEEPNVNNAHDVVEDKEIKDPVYDSSPSAVEKLISFSFSTDNHNEEPETCLPSTTINSDVLIEDAMTDVHHESDTHVTPIDKDSQEATSDEDVYILDTIPDILGDDIYNVDISDRGTSIDEDVLEAVSDVPIEDETYGVNHKSSGHLINTDQIMQEGTSDVSVDKISDLNHGSSAPVGSTDKDSQEATPPVVVVDEVSDVHHGSSEPVASTDKNLQEATSAIVFEAEVSDIHHESSEHVASTDKNLQEANSAVVFEDEVSDIHHESSEHVASTDKNLQEANSAVVFEDEIPDVHHGSSEPVASTDTNLQEANSAVVFEDEVPDVHHGSSEPVASTDTNLQEATSAVVFEDEVSDVHHGSSEPVASTDKNLQEATSAVIFEDEVPDVHQGSSEPVASTDTNLQEATSAVVFEDEVPDVHHGSSEPVASTDKNLQEANSAVVFEDEVPDVHHGSSEPVASTGKDLQEATSAVVFEDEVPDVHHGSSEPVASTDKNLQEATSAVVFEDKVPDVHHGSSEPVASTDTNLQEATSADVFEDEVPDVHHGSSEPVASTDTNLQEATSAVVFEDEVPDVRHGSSDHGTSMEKESLAAASMMHAEEEKDMRLSNGTVSIGL